MRRGSVRRTVGVMPRRPPIDPQGTYHVGSRGVYGRTLFEDVGQHEVFLRMYTRVARKYAWETLEWALVENHHHFVIRLSQGGLSEGWREIHGGYSRWFHLIHGETRQGHLFRHGFFGRQLKTDAQVIAACRYVSLNLLRSRSRPTPRKDDWGGYGAVVGLTHPRSFHSPHALLELLAPRPAAARKMYRDLVREEHGRRRQVPSPNDVPWDPWSGDVVESAA